MFDLAGPTAVFGSPGNGSGSQITGVCEINPHRNPLNIIGFGVMDDTNPSKFIRFGDIYVAQ